MAHQIDLMCHFFEYTKRVQTLHILQLTKKNDIIILT